MEKLSGRDIDAFLENQPVKALDKPVKWVIERSYTASVSDRVTVMAKTEEEAIEIAKRNEEGQVTFDEEGFDLVADNDSIEVVNLWPTSEEKGGNLPSSN